MKCGIQQSHQKLFCVSKAQSFILISIVCFVDALVRADEWLFVQNFTMYHFYTQTYFTFVLLPVVPTWKQISHLVNCLSFLLSGLFLTYNVLFFFPLDQFNSPDNTDSLWFIIFICWFWTCHAGRVFHFNEILAEVFHIFCSWYISKTTWNPFFEQCSSNVHV